MLHTILWKFILIAFTKVDTEGREFDREAVVFAALRRLTVRMEAYAHQIKMRCLHASSQCSPPSIQVHKPPDKVEFYSAGFLSSDPNVGATPAKGARRRARRTKGGRHPTMVPFIKSQPNPRKKWITAGNKAVAPRMALNEDGNLIFKQGTYAMYHKFLEMYKDIPYPQEPARITSSIGNEEGISQPYERVDGRRRAPGMEEEESRNKIARREGAVIARATKRKLSQPIE